MFPVLIGVAVGGYALGKVVEYSVTYARSYYGSSKAKPKNKRKVPLVASESATKPKNVRVIARADTPVGVIDEANKAIKKATISDKKPKPQPKLSFADQLKARVESGEIAVPGENQEA